jgi:hypothetical protein
VKRLLPILAAALLCALRADAQQQQETTTVIVPIVGNIGGLNGIRWVTALELHNNTAAPIEMWMLLPTTAEAQAYNRTLAGGETIVMRDVIGEAFGTQTALSPLKIIASGRRSLSVRANAYPTRGGEVLTPEPIAVDYQVSFYPIRALSGLAFSDDLRTNIGLANLSDDRPATFVLALQRLPERNLAIARITLPPLTLTHTSIQSLFPMITKGNDFTVIVETPSADTYAYASVIDNSTSAARFVAPSVAVMAPAEP